MRFIISGKVQGVGYRAWFYREAEKLGITGTAVNRDDGTVEIVLSGPSDAVKGMISHISFGPPAAHVTHVESIVLE